MENKNSTEIENETLENLKDRRTVDDLLGCLLFLSKYHNRETSAESLTYGLPIHKTSMNVSMFHQASSRIGFSTRTVNRKNLNDFKKPDPEKMDGIKNKIKNGKKLTNGESQIVLEILERGNRGKNMINFQETNTNNSTTVK